MRIGGNNIVSSSTDQGTGNYGNYPLYIGARAGTSLFFNGRLYQLVIRGATTSDLLIASTEAFVANKTGTKLVNLSYDYLVDFYGNPITTDSSDPMYVNEIQTLY